MAPVARLRERVVAARAPRSDGPGPDGLPLPPALLRVQVDGRGDPGAFLERGATGAALVREMVPAAGRDLEELGAMLDFGCGCGRVARHWASLTGPELHACDYNPRLVRWCAENLPFVSARTNALEPPAPYPDARFDLVYAISVLTHLTESLAARWVADWERILRPGGLLLVTTHGDAYRDALGTRQRERYDAGEAVVVSARMAGANACAAHHPPAYVTERLLRDFELVAFRPGPSPRFRQDVYLARRR